MKEPNRSRSETPDRFTVEHYQLVQLGLHPRLAYLYRRLRRDADKDGKVQTTHTMLAAKIGLRTREQVWRLLCQLRELRLVEWQRGGELNTYWVREPDFSWIAARMEKGRP
jgi:hypothetical protein